MGQNRANCKQSYLLPVLLFTIAVFVAGRFVGGNLFDNNWSFIHWRYVPGWYIALWLVLLAALGALSFFQSEKLARFFASPAGSIASLVVVFAAFFVFQFDSFLYGGGNLRVAQIAQAEKIIYRWYEYGSILIASGLNWFFELFDLHYNTAGVYAWKTFSFICAGLSLFGALRLARALTEDTARRWILFVMLFFGPQAILYFGFVGIEPVVVTVSIWFALLMVKLHDRFTVKRLVLLWLLVGLGLFLHFTLAYLIPAAVYATLQVWCKSRSKQTVAYVIGLAVYAGLVLLTYYWADRNLEFSKFLLSPSGRNPLPNYGVFSLRHIGDFLQLIFLTFPQILIVAYLETAQCRSMKDKDRGLLLGTLLMMLGGLTVVLVLNPSNSIALDFPRFTAYLFPLAFLLAVLAAVYRSSSPGRQHRLALLAVMALLIPAAYLPTYLRIAQADGYITEYLEKHEFYYMNGCLAFRDAYFYRKEFDNADQWEWKMPVKSQDYLNLRGARDLSLSGEDNSALRSLYQMIIKNPYWTEPRALLASIQLKLGRYRLAKPHIDTCLMLEPYKKDHLINLYRYYRDLQNFPEALKTIKKAEEYYPSDPEVKTDLMIAYYRSGAFQTADSLADELLATDSSRPFPYLIKGLIAEVQKNPKAAIPFYRKFIKLAPNEPETPAIREKLNKLTTELQDKK
jgi:tetratricopeptide (TPR) repeat protein